MVEPLAVAMEVAWGVVSGLATIYFIQSLRHLYTIKASAIERGVIQAWRDYRTWASGGLTISIIADVALGAGVFFPLSPLATVFAILAIMATPVILLYGGIYLYKRVKLA